MHIVLMIIIFGKKMLQNVSHISNEGRHLIVIYQNFSSMYRKKITIILKLGRKHKTSINLHIVRKLRSSFEIEIVFTHVRTFKLIHCTLTHLQTQNDTITVGIIKRCMLSIIIIKRNIIDTINDTTNSWLLNTSRNWVIIITHYNRIPIIKLHSLP